MLIFLVPPPQVKEANEDTGYGDGALKSVRKRRVRKDWVTSS